MNIPSPVCGRISAAKGFGVTLSLPAPHVRRARDGLFQQITRLGLRTNLQLCLDAGDPVSYQADGAQWLDLSGNGYHFNLGATSGAEASDPTYTGVRGAPSSYWGFDGGDYFRYPSANPAWVEAIHKDNAKFTLVALVYSAIGGGMQLCGTNSLGAPNVGFRWFPSGIVVSSAVGATLSVPIGVGITGGVGDYLLANNQWNFQALVIDEAAATGMVYGNGGYGTFVSTYTAPSAAAAAFSMEIASSGNAGVPFSAGHRMAGFAAWSDALTLAQLDRLFNAVRRRLDI